jgi:hypothetical protein
MFVKCSTFLAALKTIKKELPPSFEKLLMRMSQERLLKKKRNLSKVMKKVTSLFGNI